MKAEMILLLLTSIIAENEAEDVASARLMEGPR